MPPTVRYLADIAACTTDDFHGGPDYRPVVLRPTPGGGDRGSIALDLLTALGKNPDVLRTEHLRGEAAWRTARAWLTGMAVDAPARRPLPRPAGSAPD